MNSPFLTYSSPAKQLVWNNYLNVESTLNYLFDELEGVPEKTVLGAPTYGRTFTLGNREDHGIMAGQKDGSGTFKVLCLVAKFILNCRFIPDAVMRFCLW